MLMEKGADPACPDAVGATALHYAVSGGHVQSQNVLVITLCATVNLFTLNFLLHLFPSSSPSSSPPSGTEEPCGEQYAVASHVWHIPCDLCTL